MKKTDSEYLQARSLSKRLVHNVVKMDGVVEKLEVKEEPPRALTPAVSSSPQTMGEICHVSINSN